MSDGGLVTWDELIRREMEKHGETWRDAVSACVVDDKSMGRKFNDGFGTSEGDPFTVWTEKRVYFPAVYDGAEWCASVARNPGGPATEHIGGQ